MTDIQKEEILNAIHNLEDRIDDLKKTTIYQVEHSHDWNGSETASTYATRLNAYLAERRGIFTALTIMGCTMTWDGKSDKLGTIDWGGN